jgi:dephospho-CoA kinase
MLRVGLTGGLGSGKSTAAMLFAQHGAYVLQADEIARELMQPGEAVYNSIVQHFGPGVVLPDGKLNRSELARLAFAEGRVEELNAIVHPATIAEQAAIATEIFVEDRAALRDETRRIGDRRRRNTLAQALRLHHPGRRLGRSEDQSLHSARRGRRASHPSAAQ